MKTAVEWLESEMLEHYSPFDNKLLYKTIHKAKEMEKDQIGQAYEDGEHNYFYSKKTGEDFESGIEYYNEKFKQ